MTPPTVEARTSALYGAEEAAAHMAGVRRFTRFKHLESFIQGVVLSDWWSEEFPEAPLEVEVSRRSRNATWSAAATHAGIGLVAIVDGAGWGMETVLHELAHLAAGQRAAHGAAFVSALEVLWRTQAGVEAWACLKAELQRIELDTYDLSDDGRLRAHLS